MKIFSAYILVFFTVFSLHAQIGMGGSPREMTVLDLNYMKDVPWLELKSDTDVSGIQVFEGVMVYNTSPKSISVGYYIWEKGKWNSWKPIKGFNGPRAKLKSITDNVTITNPVDGLVVYNTSVNAAQNLDKGYYEWLNGEWEPWLESKMSTVVTKGEVKGVLGYEPDGFGANAPNIYVVPQSGVVLNKVNCAVWNKEVGGNGHTYCAYKNETTGINWGQGFSLAKSMKGYMVTITTNNEWEWLKTNMSIGDTSSLLDKNIWIGYVKVKYADESGTKDSAKEFTWVTGEESKILWSSQSTTENNFAVGEPNDGSGIEGCTHIWYYNTAQVALSTRQWNDTKCDKVSEGYGADSVYNPRIINAVIVEFNQ